MKRILLLITLLLTICFSWNRVEAKSIPSREEKGSAGLDHNRFRYYNPQTGSYLSKDPIGLAGNNPNLYAYVHDSNTEVDPFGLMAVNNSYGVPGINDFGDWFNKMSPAQFDELWSNPSARKIIESRLRYPGKLHEWHMVSRADVFKRWGVKYEQIRDMRTLIKDVEFVNPIGRHGGLGSTKAHNEILEIIDSSLDYETFKRRLNNWADYRLKGGREALPSGLFSCK